jgi:hypothetical protein
VVSSLLLIQRNLAAVLAEVSSQPEVGATFQDEMRSYAEQVEQIREWIENAGEFGIAYESLICMIERFPFRLSGASAVKLLEVGLLMKFKSGRPEDARFDYEQSGRKKETKRIRA